MLAAWMYRTDVVKFSITRYHPGMITREYHGFLVSVNKQRTSLQKMEMPLQRVTGWRKKSTRKHVILLAVY